MDGPNEVGAPLARPLTAAEIDERIDRLTRHLAAGLGAGDGGDGRPVWVSPARWVRLMAPFLSRN